jgi:uncharacterized protein
MDITPIIPQGKNIIRGYGNMAFKINDDEYKGNIVLLPNQVEIWDAKAGGEIVAKSLEIITKNDEIEILLIGCGEVHIPLPQDLSRYFSSFNIGVEIMTTGAACRTYNVLLAEGRNVAAALIAV